jgi:general secretion pathway protein H
VHQGNMGRMTSPPTAPMAKKVEREPQVISRAGHVDASAQAGFTLLEVVCVLVIIGLLAAVVVPAIPHATSLPRIEGYALQTAALLNADHDAAQRQHREVTTVIDAPSRIIRSGVNGRVLHFPSDVTVEAVLAQRCNDRAAGPTIRFLDSGLSCGGAVALTRDGAGFQVRVNWLTGGAEVVPVN